MWANNVYNHLEHILDLIIYNIPDCSLSKAQLLFDIVKGFRLEACMS